jgi:signal transduction histidine kinase
MDHRTVELGEQMVANLLPKNSYRVHTRRRAPFARRMEPDIDSNLAARRGNGTRPQVEIGSHVFEKEEQPPDGGDVLDIAQHPQIEDARRQLNARLEQRTRQLTALNEIGRTLAATLDLHEIYRVMFREIAQGLLDTPHLIVALFDQETETIHCGFAIIDGEEMDPNQFPPIPLGEGPVSDTIRTRQPRMVDLRELFPDLEARGRAVLKGSERLPQSALYLPMIGGDRVIGVMHLQSYDADAFRDADMTLLSTLASQAAMALANAQFYQQSQEEINERAQTEAQLRRRNRELALLNRVVATATSTLDVEQVLKVTCSELARAFDVPQAAAALLNAEGTEVSIVAEYRTAGNVSYLGQTIPVTDNPATEIVLEGNTPLAIIDAQTDERLANVHELIRTLDIVSLLIVPITVARGRVAGTIGLHAAQRREFSAEEITLAQSVAAAAGQALETARLYQALRSHADRLGKTVALRTVELEQALERAQDADRVKSEFVSNVSHELRTPLTNIKLYLSLLTRGREEKRPAYLETVHRETARLQNLIEGLLDLSRLDLGKIQAILQSTDLGLLVSTLAADREALVVARGLCLDVEFVESLPPVHGDDKLIEQVLNNLLTNAVNYTPSGGTITLSTALVEAEGQTWATVSVTDTGPGISETEKSRLFERFYRGEAGQASDAPGTGLGLAICKEIMDLHGGRITLESEVGRGSTFTVWLRIA